MSEVLIKAALGPLAPLVDPLARSVPLPRDRYPYWLTIVEQKTREVTVTLDQLFGSKY